MVVMNNYIKQIWIPNELLSSIYTLTQIENETGGLIIGSQSNRIFVPFLALRYDSKNGSAKSMTPDINKFKAIERFYEKNFKKKIMHPFNATWHTHTVATGEYWYDKFSNQDLKNIEDLLEEDNTDLSMLFTPSNIVAKSFTYIPVKSITFNSNGRTLAQYLKQEFNAKPVLDIHIN